MGHLKSKRTEGRKFNRPESIGGQVDRVWKTVKIKDLQKDDIIAGKGVVKLIFETCGPDYYLEAGENTDGEFDPDVEVYAFVRKDK